MLTARSLQVCLGRQAKLGYSAASAMRPATFWSDDSQHVLCAVLSAGKGVILVAMSRVTSSPAHRLVRPTLKNSRRLHILEAIQSLPAAQVLEEHDYRRTREGSPIQACTWAPSGQALVVVTTPLMDASYCKHGVATLLVFTNSLELLWDQHEEVRSWAWAPCSSYMLIATQDRVLKTINVPGATHDSPPPPQLAVLNTCMPPRRASRVRWSSSGTWCMVCGGMLLAQHAAGRPFRLSLPDGMQELQLLCLSPSGGLILLAGEVPGYATVGMPARETVLWLLDLSLAASSTASWLRLPVPPSRLRELHSVAFHPQERFFAALTATSVLVISLLGEIVHRVTHSTGEAHFCQPDSRRLLFASCGCRLLVRLDYTRALLLSFAPGPASACSIGFEQSLRHTTAGYSFALHGLAAPPPR